MIFDIFPKFPERCFVNWLIYGLKAVFTRNIMEKIKISEWFCHLKYYMVNWKELFSIIIKPCKNPSRYKSSLPLGWTDWNTDWGMSVARGSKTWTEFEQRVRQIRRRGGGVLDRRVIHRSKVCAYLWSPGYGRHMGNSPRVANVHLQFRLRMRARFYCLAHAHPHPQQSTHLVCARTPRITHANTRSYVHELNSRVSYPHENLNE